jgi:hypothetical protein
MAQGISLAMRQRIIKASITGIILLISLLVVVLLWRSTANIQTLLVTWYSDDRLVKWVGVVVNLAVVGIALFLNVLLDQFHQPRFDLTCGDARPWQVEKKSYRLGGLQLLHVRLQVQNVGRSYEGACEVRVEQVFRLFSAKEMKPEPIHEHDPRPLKWVGRDTKPITLNAGAFDFVDLGIRHPDSLENFRLDFADRGHLDLWLNEKDVAGFRIVGTVYGMRAKPKSFAFDLSWKSYEFGPILLKEL